MEFNFKKIIIAVILFFITVFSFAVIKGDEEIIFFPSFGIMKNGSLTAEVHGWVFEPEKDSVWRNVIMEGLKKALDEDIVRRNPEIYEKRIRFFLVDNKSNKEIQIKIGEREYDLGKTRPDGHFSGSLVVRAEELRKTLLNDSVEFSFHGFLDQKRKATNSIRIIRPEGISVISDIDDTIKISNVHDKKEMLKNTFLRDFAPVPGMPALYASWEKQGAVFHYVSGSPWQLYVPLKEFLEKNNFPRGFFRFKKFRLKDSSSLRFVTMDQFEYKTAEIEKIMNAFPARKFILVGDSGEKDPEVYGHIAGKYKDRIIAIYIRKVADSKSESTRYKALNAKAGKKIILFQDASELPRDISFPADK